MMDSEIRIIIVEDMVNYLDAIEMLLKEVAPWVNVAGKATTLKEAEKLIEELSPDAILLDIQFENEGKTGFDLIDSLKARMKLNFQIIIITAHHEKQYYAKAFEYKALHFLEKPINKLKLADAMMRVKELHLGTKFDTLASRVENVTAFQKPVPQLSKISFRGARYSELIDINDIMWIEADGRKSIIHQRNERNIVSTDSIGEIEDLLSGYNNFLKISRSKIVNLNFVERYSRKERLIVIAGKDPNHFASKNSFAEFIVRINADKPK